MLTKLGVDSPKNASPKHFLRLERFTEGSGHFPRPSHWWGGGLPLPLLRQVREVLLRAWHMTLEFEKSMEENLTYFWNVSRWEDLARWSETEPAIPQGELGETHILTVQVSISLLFLGRLNVFPIEGANQGLCKGELLNNLRVIWSQNRGNGLPGTQGFERSGKQQVKERHCFHLLKELQSKGL